MGIVRLPTESEPVVMIQGDCLDLLPALAVGSVDCTITDPPYGVGLGVGKDKRGGSPKKRHGLAKPAYANTTDTYPEFVAVVPPAIRACLSLASRAAVFVGPHVWDMPKADLIGGVYCPSAVGRNAWGFKNLLPVLFYGKAPDLHKGAKEPTVFRTTGRAEKNGHPCPKPLVVMRWLVRLCTRPGELIFDPFGGSGTTAVAAVLEGRRCLLVEKEPTYAEIARNRVAEAVHSLAAGAPDAGIR